MIQGGNWGSIGGIRGGQRQRLSAPLFRPAFRVSLLRTEPQSTRSLSMKSLFCGLVAACLLISAACGRRGGDTSKPTVAYVTNGIANFWKIAEKGARDAAADPKI